MQGFRPENLNPRHTRSGWGHTCPPGVGGGQTPQLSRRGLGWVGEDGRGRAAEVALGWGGGVTINSTAGPPGIPAPRTSRRPGWGRGSCQKMRRWPSAADAAAAFIFKLPSGQRARRGRGPRRAGRLHPLPFRGPPIPFSHLASGIPGAAPVPGSEREPLSMAAASLGAGGGSWGSQRRRRRRPAARIGVPRRITPGPARRAAV